MATAPAAEGFPSPGYTTEPGVLHPTIAPTRRTNEKSQIDQERVRADFYATYDVMTGVRIAATLGGFFGLMVFLVVYKSRSKSHKALKDPRIVAAAQAEALQQERRELRQALEQAALENLVEATERGDMRAARRSLDVGATCAAWTAYNTRFSSVGGGYSSLLAPGHRLSRLRHTSLPGSALRFSSSSHYYTPSPALTPHLYPRRLHEPQYSVEEEDPDDSLIDTDLGPSRYHLTVPRDSRRCSSATCSSSDTSYLERRGSWFISEACTSTGQGAGLGGRRKRDARYPRDEDADDNFYPIDIQVIGATPRCSPQPIRRPLERQRALDLDAIPGQTTVQIQTRRAPLASLGSCAEPWTSEFQPGDDTDEDFDDEELLSSDCEDVIVSDTNKRSVVFTAYKDSEASEIEREGTIGQVIVEDTSKVSGDYRSSGSSSCSLDNVRGANDVQLQVLTENRTKHDDSEDLPQETLF